jgi:hypothetical protein
MDEQDDIDVIRRRLVGIVLGKRLSVREMGARAVALAVILGDEMTKDLSISLVSQKTGVPYSTLCRKIDKINSEIKALRKETRVTS